MAPSKFLIIILIEVIALLSMLCVFLAYRNRTLRNLVKKLRARLKKMVGLGKESEAEPPKQDTANEDLDATEEREPAGITEPNLSSLKSYRSFISEQIELTQAHHSSLNPEQDIVLEIDPNVPDDRRTAAFRNAVLSFELAACAANHQNTPDWDIFTRKYKQLFSFQEDYTNNAHSNDTQQEDHPPEELVALREELMAAKQHNHNLEKYRTLYVDLEKRWHRCQEDAQQHFNTLSDLKSNLDDSTLAESFGNSITAYKDSYTSITQLIEGGVNTTPETQFVSNNSREVGQLRTLAAQQNRIIDDLRNMLAKSKNDQQTDLVKDLEYQLEIQTRYVKESETCIQLMEVEMGTMHDENENLKQRLNIVPTLKEELKELREENAIHEKKIFTLTAIKQKLEREQKESGKSAPASSDNTELLKQQLADMQEKYEDLEERFLDLKISS